MKNFLRVLRKKQARIEIAHAYRRVARISRELADLQGEKRAAVQSLESLKLFVRSI